VAADLHREALAELRRAAIWYDEQLDVLLLPTGSIEEVSLSSGWAHEFLELASRYDAAIARWLAAAPGRSTGR
jgi:hypothetical protein